MLLYANQLTGFIPANEESTNTVLRGELNGRKAFYKMPPTEMSDEAKNIRILNEAICGTVAHIICEKLNSTIITPTHQLVIDRHSNQLTGVVSYKVAFDHLGNFGATEELFKNTVKSALGKISAIRYFLMDPDGIANIGYANNSHSRQLSSIDYGLANYLYLAHKNALLDGENEKIPDDSVFHITTENIFIGFVKELKNHEYLSHHIFNRFHKFLENADEANCTQFFNDIYTTLAAIPSILANPFCKSEIIKQLGIEYLLDADKETAHKIINFLIKRANTLKDTYEALQTLSETQLKALAEQENTPPKTTSIIVRTASPDPRILKRSSSSESSPEKSPQTSPSKRIARQLAETSLGAGVISPRQLCFFSSPNNSSPPPSPREEISATRSSPKKIPARA